MNKLFETFNFQFPNTGNKLTAVDMHTGGEPLRIPITGLPELKGNSILEKRRYFKEHYDHIRTGLMFEPRGHADMYGAILSESTVPEADLDVFFIHNEGYSTMCGHAILALTKFVIENQLLADNQLNKIVFNVPCGLVRAEGYVENGRVVSASFENVPSYVYLKDEKIEIHHKP